MMAPEPGLRAMPAQAEEWGAAFALLPIALGRWPLGKAEAGGLIIAYTFYLALTMRKYLLG